MSTESIWASIKVDWHDQAACAGASSYFFPDTETLALLTEVRERFCDRCPVQAKCLNSALVNGGPGFWGGTSTSQRVALKKARHRATCPRCQAKTLVEIPDDPDGSTFQVCIACGASWRSAPRLHLATTENDQSVGRI